mmetsp:Transcript_94933/g.272255  ORF Transcript_94933/g.272255 Transcript_94933/m.272255 type:complete len:202 (+) Transcript_94933:326-931(+)
MSSDMRAISSSSCPRAPFVPRVEPGRVAGRFRRQGSSTSAPPAENMLETAGCTSDVVAASRESATSESTVSPDGTDASSGARPECPGHSGSPRMLSSASSASGAEAAATASTSALCRSARALSKQSDKSSMRTRYRSAVASLRPSQPASCARSAESYARTLARQSSESGSLAAAVFTVRSVRSKKSRKSRPALGTTIAPMK